MSEKTWMPLYIGDYLADTQHLSAEEHGAYLLLIMHYWRNGKAIKNDKNLIKNIAKISQKKLTNILAFFEEKDGMLYHKRIEDELIKAAENNEKNKERTRKATASRIEKLQRDVAENANVTLDVTNNVTFTPSPSPSPKERDELRIGACAESILPEEIPKPPPSSTPPTDFQRVYELGSEIFPRFATANTSPIHQWLTAGCDVELDIIPEIKRMKGRDIGGWGYFTGQILMAKDIRLAPPTRAAPIGKATGETLDSLIEKVGKRMVGEDYKYDKQ